MAKAVKLADIAAVVGVSTVTVSKALSDQKGVSEELREKIKQLAEEIHAFIRKTIADKYGAEVAEEISILYGGSCKPSNAKEIFSKPNVDGGLIRV